MSFKIIVHYPRSTESKCELERRIAEAHAQAIAPYIQLLSCPKEQKLALVKSIQTHAKIPTTED